MYQGTLVAQAILVVAHTDYHNLWVHLQASKILLGRSAELQGEELEVGLDAGDERHSHRREDRIELGTCGLRFLLQVLVDVVIHDIALTRYKLLWLLSTYIYIVRFCILVVAEGTFAMNAVADDNWYVAATDVANGSSLTTGRVQPIEGRTSLARNHQLSLLLSDVIHQVTSYWNLGSRFLAEADTNGVADAISQ